MERINVTCAIVVIDSKILACQKTEGSDHSFEWEFPGGKIEHYESAEQCIIREMKEELNVDVEVICQLLAVDHDYVSKKICLIPFVCNIVKGQPQALEHELIKWQELKSINDLNWSDADKKLYLLNKKRIECLH